MRVLEQAERIVKRNWPRGKWWKTFIVISLIVVGVIGLIIMVIWLLGRLVKSLSVGGFRNRDLYIPKIGRS